VLPFGGGSLPGWKLSASHRIGTSGAGLERFLKRVRDAG
jgi:hypothetical protein